MPRRKIVTSSSVSLAERPQIDTPTEEALQALSEKVQAEASALASAPVLPPPISPAVISLQEDIVAFTRERGDVRRKLVVAQNRLASAQADFQSVQAELNLLDQEVQYRLQIIAQMENRTPAYPPTAPSGSLEAVAPLSPPVTSLTGIASVPSPRGAVANSRWGDDDMVNRGHADRSLATDVRSVL